MKDSTIPAFDYVMDGHQLIYISMGLEYRDQLCVSLSYVPSEQGTKVTAANKEQRYIKQIFCGFESQQKLTTNPGLRPYAEYLHSLGATSEIGEELLLLSKDSIVKHFSSRQAFRDIASIPNFASSPIAQAADIMKMAGVGEDAIGLYGGIVAGLERTAQLPTGRLLNDVDLVIEGLDNYDILKDVMAARGAFIDTPTLLAADIADREAILNQWHASCFKILDDMGCDVRFRRQPNDKNSYLTILGHGGITQKEIELQKLKVIESPESLTVPMSYTLQTNSGDIVTVASLYYKFLGRVREGDVVDISGQLVTSQPAASILLTNPERHFIRNAR